MKQIFVSALMALSIIATASAASAAGAPSVGWVGNDAPLSDQLSFWNQFGKGG